MRRILLFCLLFIHFLPQMEALNRDYSDRTFPHCFSHLTPSQLKQSNITHELARFIPAFDRQCIEKADYYPEYRKWHFTYCPNLSFYFGYIDFSYCKFRSHLRRHLEYCQKYPDCTCFWPELSQNANAANISDTAYLLFRDLILTTALSSLLEDDEEQCEFILTDTEYCNIHGLTIALIARQLHFIDYYNVCHYIRNYSSAKYEEKEDAEINDRVDDILEVLYQKFLDLYVSCYSKHPNEDICNKISFMKFLMDDISGFDKPTRFLNEFSSPSRYKNFSLDDYIISNLQTIDTPIQLEEPKALSDQYNQIQKRNCSESFILTEASVIIDPSFSPESDMLLEQGTLFNNLLLYKEAIDVLTLAIQLNPSNLNAYLERAMAYFETNQLSLAIQDYEIAKKLKFNPPFKLNSQQLMKLVTIYIPENKLEFSNGLFLGVIEGGNNAALEFIPSLVSSCRGILQGLWAFACSPREISQNMLNTAYAMGDFISTHSSAECFQCVVPELKELSLTWAQDNDYSKGKKIGYLIGKYGLEILAPAGFLKGISKYRALKRANTMYTLECCTASQAKNAKILEESFKRAVKREVLINDSIKSGKILVKNKNVQYHVMQPKHAWDKIVRISGNAEEDFRKVLTFLEDKKIINPNNLRNTTAFPPDKLVKNIHLLEYSANVEGHSIQIFLEKYLETGEIFLKNGWVVTK